MKSRVLPLFRNLRILSRSHFTEVAKPLNMGDIKDRKYKGKICSPDAKTLAKKKSTREFCGGKTGLLHDEVTVYDSRPDQNFGLAARSAKKCARCGKSLTPWYGQEGRVTHTFGAIVRAIRTQRGMRIDALAKKASMPVDVVGCIEADTLTPRIGTISRIAEALNVSFSIEFRERGKDGRWNDGVCLDLSRYQD